MNNVLLYSLVGPDTEASRRPRFVDYDYDAGHNATNVIMLEATSKKGFFGSFSQVSDPPPPAPYLGGLRQKNSWF